MAILPVHLTQKLRCRKCLESGGETESLVFAVLNTDPGADVDSADRHPRLVHGLQLANTRAHRTQGARGRYGFGTSRGHGSVGKWWCTRRCLIGVGGSAARGQEIGRAHD